MKPLPAVGLASSIVQIIDFAIKILQKEQKIYQPTDAELVENHAVLQDIVNNLYRLTLKIDQNDLKKLNADPKSGKLSEPAQHLLKLSDETKELTNPLIDAILQAQARGSYGDPKWNTAREALLTIQKKKEITGLKKKLRAVRKDVDTALLLALRQYLDQSAETGLPVFSAEDSRIHHWERWQNEAMDAIHTNDWKPKNKKNVEEFSKQVDGLIQAENEAYFCTEVFANLKFETMDDRLQSIPVPHEGNFEWIFGEDQKEGGLLQWLGDMSGQNLFWITGEPGSGKSTLTKYLFRNSRIFPSLEAWSGHSPGITAGFFFWACGTELQKSPIGLLRSLLYESLQDMIYGPLEQDPGIIQWLFADRWNQFTSYGGGLHSFVFPELRRSFELMVSDVTKKFLFMLDGLDELDDYSNELIDLILSATKRDNVKICTASRPSPIFQNAFEKRPNLRLDQFTKTDIQAYVLHTFSQDDTLAKIRSKENDATTETNIISVITEKASGIYLWASLATDFILQSAKETDEMSSLQSQVDALPSDLDTLLLHIFQSLDESDLSQASRIFRLVDAHGYPSLLELSFATDSDMNSTIAADVRPLKSSELTKRIDKIRDLLQVQCRNFLIIFDASDSSFYDEDVRNGAAKSLESLRVNYMHRHVKDFIHSSTIQNKIRQATGEDSFIASEHWANASLWTLKTRPTTSPSKLHIWESLAWSIEYALRLEDLDKKVRLSYLDEVGRSLVTVITAHQSQPSTPTNAPTTDLPSPPSVDSFFDIAVWLNLTGYVANKAKTAERKEVRHAIEYNKELRKRLGMGGEQKWINSGDGVGGERKRLKSVYVRTTPELDQLLEYYTKAVRFATPKPFVEVPEYI